MLAMDNDIQKRHIHDESEWYGVNRCRRNDLQHHRNSSSSSSSSPRIQRQQRRYLLLQQQRRKVPMLPMIHQPPSPHLPPSHRPARQVRLRQEDHQVRIPRLYYMMILMIIIRILRFDHLFQIFTLLLPTNNKTCPHHLRPFPFPLGLVRKELQ